MSTAYIVANTVLETTPPKGCKEWHATGIPSDATKSLLVVVEWNNPNEEAAFGLLPDVLVLGAPWESLPADAVPMLASLEDPERVAAQAAVALPLVEGEPVALDKVSTVLNKIAWPGARMVR